jgi:hypothetical protein
MAVSVAFYRVLLRLCPQEFRNSYGDEAAATFAEALARLRDAGNMSAAITFALAGYFDIVVTALREHATIVGGDVAFALRLMAKSWLSSAIVIATLALAIGIGATVFSAIDTVLLAPLPYCSRRCRTKSRRSWSLSSIVPTTTPGPTVPKQVFRTRSIGRSLRAPSVRSVRTRAGRRRAPASRCRKRFRDRSSPAISFKLSAFARSSDVS